MSAARGGDINRRFAASRKEETGAQAEENETIRDRIVLEVNSRNPDSQPLR